MQRLQLDSDELVAPTYSARFFSHEVPKYRLAREGMSAEGAYRVVHDELNLDGNPALNLASFVTGWMEPHAEALAAETLGKNLIDEDEYPQTAAIHERVTSIIGHLFHAPAHERAIGTATIGPSEAIMLAMLAHKRAWQIRRRAARESLESPNLVMGADVHTVWEKFARYFEVEPRIVPMEENRYTIGASELEHLIDENTIAVAGLVGTTFTGQMDDLASIDALLTRLASERGLRVPSTSTPRAAVSSSPSPSPSSRGTSALRACARSTSQTTSSGSCTRAWGRSSSATRAICPRSSCSTSTTSAATCPTTR